MTKRFSTLKTNWPILLMGVVLGVLALLVVRFATYQHEGGTHYHANLAVYINGQREEFKAAQYYQEVAICSATSGITLPEQRAHMHSNINDVVHVHDHAVTWGQFFANLGWYIGPDFIQTDTGQRYVNDGASKLHILIDGQDYTDLTPVTNMVIKDQSRLLVSFGDIDDATLQKEAAAIQNNAKKADESKDPSTCSSNEPVTVSERLHHLL